VCIPAAQGYEGLLRILNDAASQYSGNGDSNNAEPVPLARLLATDSAPRSSPRPMTTSKSAKVVRSLAALNEERELFKFINGALRGKNAGDNGDVAAAPVLAAPVLAAATVVAGETTPVRRSPPPTPEDTQLLREPLLVIIRHGKTEHNKLGLFTGWEDAPLHYDGKQEAAFAGKLMKAHGIQFDVVYTSWLSRVGVLRGADASRVLYLISSPSLFRQAIETALSVIDELDSLWVPLVKTWRLNERM
jgi:Histidine phosphatase superfamily (branch 1)